MPATTLRAILQDGLNRERGSVEHISAIKRVNYFRSTHSFARLLVGLENGERLPVIAKRLRRGIKRYGNEREILIYQRILPHRRFGAPALYGSQYDDRLQHFVLLLEDVGDETLESGDIDDWERAVTGLAEMHGRFLGRDDELRDFECLHEHDAPYYHAIVEDARANLTLAGTPASQHRVARLRASVDSLIHLLCRAPRTLVHGDLFPGNVMVQSSARVRTIDWEAAAIGVGAFDLASLLEGWSGERRHRLVAAYWESLERSAGVPVDARAFARQLQACEVLQPFRYLAWDVEYCADTVTANELLDSLERGLASWDGIRRHD